MGQHQTLEEQELKMEDHNPPAAMFCPAPTTDRERLKAIVAPELSVLALCFGPIDREEDALLWTPWAQTDLQMPPMDDASVRW